MQECTFRPTINNKSEFYARKTRGCYIEPLADRLHHEADKREALRSKAKELMEADALCSYTFQPQINRQPQSKQASRAPIHERTPVIQRRKQEKVRAVQTAEERRTECSFQPRISGRSEKLVQKKRDKLYRSLSQGDASCLKMLGPVEERLYAAAQATEQRRAAKQDVCSEASQSTPSMDDASRRICKNSVYFQGAQQDFLMRQQTFELAKQRRMEVRAQHADAACSFRPKISDTSRQLVSGNLDLVGETAEDRIARLAVKDVERRDQLREALEQRHYRECTFKPEVNSASQALASRMADDAASCDSEGGAAVHERLYRSSAGRSRLSEDSQPEEHSFRPQMDPRSAKRFAHVKPHYASKPSQLMENIREELDRKQELIMERRRELEEHELEGCTFAPETHKAYEEPQRPVVVSGLGRFFELRDRAQKQQQELREREAKVFRPEQSGAARSGGSGVTIPEPFVLSTGQRDECPQPAARRQDLSRRLDEIIAQTGAADGREAVRQFVNSQLAY